MYILVTANHFMRYVRVHATKYKSAKELPRRLFLMTSIIPSFGFPNTIQHDMDKKYENNLFKKLEKLSGASLF